MSRSILKSKSTKPLDPISLQNKIEEDLKAKRIELMKKHVGPAPEMPTPPQEPSPVLVGKLQHAGFCNKNPDLTTLLHAIPARMTPADVKLKCVNTIYGTSPTIKKCLPPEWLNDNSNWPIFYIEFKADVPNPNFARQSELYKTKLYNYEKAVTQYTQDLEKYRQQRDAVALTMNNVMAVPIADFDLQQNSKKTKLATTYFCSECEDEYTEFNSRGYCESCDIDEENDYEDDD